MTEQETGISKIFWVALAVNFVWINFSEVVRYFAIIKPMLHKTFPGADDIAAVTPSIFASWMLWDTVLIFAATGFYWMYLKLYGKTWSNVALSASFFTITVFGLIWLGVANMGLAPISFLWVALPLAWVEQFIAAFIVCWIIGRGEARKPTTSFPA